MRHYPPAEQSCMEVATEPMSVVICPGIHAVELTQSFLVGLQSQGSPDLRGNFLIFPGQDYAVLSAIHILQFLREHLGDPPAAPGVVFISFSAGVVGAVGAAWGWQLLGGNVKAFIAIDGWGVPLGKSNFPLHRLSHDDFTHWSSALLGSGEDNFYADPPVAHLEMWRSPQIVQGCWVHSEVGESQPRTSLTAAQFLTMLLELYGEI